MDLTQEMNTYMVEIIQKSVDNEDSNENSCKLHPKSLSTNHIKLVQVGERNY